MIRPAVMSLALTGFVVALAPAATAQRQQAVGAGVTQLDTLGELKGVDMSGSATTGTLDIGVLNGPATNIDSSNNPLVTGVLAISTAVTSQGNIVFNSGSTVYGAIGQAPPTGPYFLLLSAGNTGTVVNFLGPVYATTITNLGTGTINFESGTDNAGATSFGGNGTITLAADTSLTGAITTVAADTGTLALGAGSLIGGAVGGGAGLKTISMAAGTATIQGAADTYTMSLGTGTLVINGALALADGGAGGVVNTTIASNTLYGNVRVLGATSLGPAVTINVNVPASAALTVGTVFDIIQTQAGTTQTGTDGSVITAAITNTSNPLYSFVAVPLAGTINGLVAIKVTSIPLLVPITPVTPVTPVVPTQPIAAPVVPVLITLPASPAVIALIGTIDALTTPAQVTDAVAALAPSTADLATPDNTFIAASAFQDLAMTRLQPLCAAVARTGGTAPPTATCHGTGQPAGWWLKAFGYAGNQNAQHGFTGYTSNLAGTMIGYDAPLGPDSRLGLAVGYARGNINQYGADTGANFNTYQATAYLGHLAGPWFVNADLSFGWNDYTETRQISFPGFGATAQGRYSGRDYTGYAITGYNIAAGRLTLTPLASLQYTYVSLDKYVESGAGVVSLNVGSQAYSYLQSGLGAEASEEFQVNGGVLLAQLHAKWLHSIANPDIRETAAFNVPGSDSFTTPGYRTGADIFNGGAGITLLSCACTTKLWSIEAVYDFYARTRGYVAHAGMLKYTRSF